MMEVFGSYKLKEVVLAESMYPLDSRILLVPLNEVDLECWDNFKTTALFRNHEGELLVDPHHPIVRIMAHFAISAFNQLCKLYYKTGVEKNIYGAQVTKFTFTSDSHGCTFFITIEALEEDVVGVYHATVLSTFRQGLRTLIQFTRLPLSPTGTKYKGMDDLIRQEFISNAIKDEEKYLKSLLNTRRNALKGGKKSRLSGDRQLKKRYQALAGARRLFDKYALKWNRRSWIIKTSSSGGKTSRLSGDIKLKKRYQALAGARRLFDKYAPQLNQRSWIIKTSSSDDWLVPDEKTGLHPRSNEHTFGGYDYLNPLKAFSYYTSRMLGGTSQVEAGSTVSNLGTR